MAVSSLYIHIPFCKDRCYYCDFYSEKLNESAFMTEAYTEALKEEFNFYRPYLSEKIHTIYIGGGTPSSLSVKDIEGLLGFLCKNLNFAKDYEFTFEMNPESVSSTKLLLLKDYRVNRISLGIQSLNNSTLRKLNRIHTGKTAITSLEKIFKYGFKDVGTDFLIGTTKDTDSLISEISDVLCHPVRHISAYILTLSKKSIKILPEEITAADEDIVAEQYNLLHRFLTERGFIHYEISNFAKQGYQSKHNLNYWNNGYYIGLGASAAGHYINSSKEIVRYKNISDLRQYIKGIKNSSLRFEEFEKIDRKTDLNEYIMLGLRTQQGIYIEKLKRYMDKNDFRQFFENALRLKKDGLLKITDRTLSPTLRGFILNNVVVRELMF
ncbi:MAG: radical SAM family heme chaperone HemW [Deltaproteobacteria bacterium]|nr:radical SAM family heme chaperone HemW [Deltaproteobacteria bacterium]